jgi:hypothetical protein
MSFCEFRKFPGKTAQPEPVKPQSSVTSTAIKPVIVRKSDISKPAIKHQPETVTGKSDTGPPKLGQTTGGLTIKKSFKPEEREDLKTYIIFGSAGLNHDFLREILNPKGWKEISQNSKSADFVWAELDGDAGIPKKSYDIKCTLKNLLNDEKKRLVDKFQLYENMKNKYPAATEEYMAETRLLTGVENLKKGEILIAKPIVEGWAGKGIIRITNGKELEKAKLSLKKDPSAIASKYITNLMLWEGRKMHFRMYLIVCSATATQPFKSELWTKGKILTAAKKYENKDFENNDIHDTHAHSTVRNLFYPDDLDVTKEIKKSLFDQMNKIIKYPASILRPFAKPYPESQYGYEVFGVDFLPTADNIVILLEINEKVGFSPVETDDDSSGKYAQFTKEYYEWVYRTAISPVFGS